MNSATMIGGGEEKTIRCTFEGKRIECKARVNLLETWIAVVTEGPQIGMLGLPIWEDEAKLVSSSGEIPDIEWTSDKVHYVLYRSLYYALRNVMQIFQKYHLAVHVGEHAAMQEALTASRELNQIFLGVRKDNEKEFEALLAGKIQSMLGRLSPRPKNLYKKEGQMYLGELRTARDRLGRVNQSAKMAISKAAERRFSMRDEQICFTMPVLAERQKALEILRDLIALRFSSAKEFLENLLEESNYQKLFGNPVQRVNVGARLYSLAQDIAAIDIQPYTFTAAMVAKEFQQAQQLLLKNQPWKAREILDISLRSLRLKAAQQRIEDLITDITIRDDGTLDKRSLDARIKDVYLDLKNIPEAGFVISTKEGILVFLETAQAFLQAGSMKQCRAALKEASNVMQALPQGALHISNTTQ